MKIVYRVSDGEILAFLNNAQNYEIAVQVYTNVYGELNYIESEDLNSHLPHELSYFKQQYYVDDNTKTLVAK